MIIFDLSNIFFINMHASMEETEELDEKGNKIKRFDEAACRYQILNTVRAVTSKYKGKYGKVVFACDARSLWRKNFFPPYKSHRKADRDAQVHINWKEVFAFFDAFKKELRSFTKYKIIEVDLAEADDVIAALTIKYSDQTNMIVSTDKDFKQLQVYTDVTIYNPIANEIVKAEDPFAYLHEHIIRGDRGDGVPNIISDDDALMNDDKKQGTLTAARMHHFLTYSVSEWDSADALLDYFINNNIKKEEKKAEVEAIILKAKDNYLNRNKILIDLREVPEEITDAIIDKYKEEKSSGMRSLFDYFYKYNLTKLMSSISDF